MVAAVLQAVPIEPEGRPAGIYLYEVKARQVCHALLVPLSLLLLRSIC